VALAAAPDTAHRILEAPQQGITGTVGCSASA
jgi:hypothetical protein